MTLEEKAEKSFEKARKRDIGLSYGSYYDGYIAGATENGVVWHDLRKNPKDLPTCYCETITLHENGNKNIQRWLNGNWTNAIVIHIVAWCEIPTFKEES